MDYFKEVDSKPDKADFYAMQIAAEVRRGHVKNPKNVDVNDFVLSMKPKEEPKVVWTEEDRERISQETMGIWMARLGTKAKVKIWQPEPRLNAS